MADDSQPQRGKVMDEMALQSKKMDDISAKKGPKSLGQGELAAAIASGESDSCGGYDAFNITTSSKVTHSSREGDKIEGKKLSEYSLGEMLKLSKQSTTNVTDKNGKTTKYSGKLWAAGRYQVTAATLHGKMYSSGNGIRQGTKEFGPNTLFDQVAQDICYEYIINKSRLPVHNYLYGNGSIDAAAKSLAQCWASIGVKGTNKSYYAGDGMNGTMAHTKYETIIKALKADKAAIERGDLASATMQPNVKGDDTPVVKDNPVVVSDEGEKKAAEPVIGKGNIKLKTDPDLRIRDKASRDGSNVIGRIANGAEFEYTKEENGWLRIRSGAGYGWICKQYTSLYLQPEAAGSSSKAADTSAKDGEVVDGLKVHQLSSGTWAWCNNSGYVNGQSLDQLEGDFKDKAKNIIGALRAAGVGVSVASTLRHPVRAAIMRYTFRYSREGVKDQKSLDLMAKHGVTVTGDRKAATAAVAKFGIAYTPSVTSNHIYGHAVDMSLSNLPAGKQIQLYGKTMTIQKGSASSKSTAESVRLNNTLNYYGIAGFKKMLSDKPHWSHNGR